MPVFATLDSTAGLRLGSLDGPAAEQFGYARDLAPLPDGGVAVLDAQAAEVRVFGPDGAHVRTLGKRGQGPGEFTSPVALARVAGDSLAVYDSRLGRVTVFAPDGSLGRVVTVAFDGYGRPYRASFFSDVRMVGQSTFTPGSLGADGEAAFHQDSAVLVVNTPTGALVDTVGIQPTSEEVLTITQSDQGISITKVGVRFARSGVFVAHPDGVWSGFGDHWELRLHDPADGQLKRIVRAPGLDRPLTDAEAKSIVDEALARDTTPDQLRAWRKLNELSPRPELRPAYDRLLVDDQERLWLREWPGASSGTLRWWVFAVDGGLLGQVNVPGGFQLLAVSGAQAWGVTRDELGVPYVERHALRMRGLQGAPPRPGFRYLPGHDSRHLRRTPARGHRARAGLQRA
jgi:hypothetical protein